MRIVDKLFEISITKPGSTISLLNDVTNYEKLIFLFGSPNNTTHGYGYETLYPWGVTNNKQLGVAQPNFSLNFAGEKHLFQFTSNVELKFISGFADLRAIYGFKRR